MQFSSLAGVITDLYTTYYEFELLILFFTPLLALLTNNRSVSQSAIANNTYFMGMVGEDTDQGSEETDQGSEDNDQGSEE